MTQVASQGLIFGPAQTPLSGHPNPALGMAPGGSLSPIRGAHGNSLSACSLTAVIPFPAPNA